MFHVFWPFTIQSSPSRTADVRSDARSEPAFGSEKPWHQMSSPRSMRGSSVALLLVGAVLDDRGRDVREAERVERARRAGAVHLLGVHDLFHDARAAAAPLLGPRDRGVARVGERAVPRAQARRARSPSISSDPPSPSPARSVGEVGVEPGAELLAERLGFGRIA